MAKITRFEDLICWQKARDLVKPIYVLTELKRFSQDHTLKDQIRRAAVSVMSNIAEGFSRFHKKEFIRFLDISKSSASEVKSLLYVTVDQGYLSKHEFDKAYTLSSETEHTTLGLIRYLNRAISSEPDRVREASSTYQKENEAIELPDEYIKLNTPNS